MRKHVEKVKGFFKVKTNSRCWFNHSSLLLQLSHRIACLLQLINDLSLVVFAMLFGLACGFSILAYVWITLLLPFAYVRFAMLMLYITIFSTLVAYYNPQSIHLKKTKA